MIALESYYIDELEFYLVLPLAAVNVDQRSCGIPSLSVRQFSVLFFFLNFFSLFVKFFVTSSKNIFYLVLKLFIFNKFYLHRKFIGKSKLAIFVFVKLVKIRF